jgi:hypothetical protein
MITVTTKSRLLVVVLTALCIGGCGESQSEKKAALERALAEVEGEQTHGTAAGESQPGDIAATPARLITAVPAPPAPEVAAWADAIGRRIERTYTKSRQAIGPELLRMRNDPRAKGEMLLVQTRWCDEGDLVACLQAAHVLLYNECLYDRARELYGKAEALAAKLPAEALAQRSVDGRAIRDELRQGLQLSGRENRDDPQVRSIEARCGAAAERDRPLWDELFARESVDSGVSPTTPEERLVLSAVRKRMLLEAREEIATLGQLDRATAQALSDRLARTAGAMCGQGDVAACGAASAFYGEQCQLDEMASAYRSFETHLSTADPTVRGELTLLVSDMIGPAKTYVEGGPADRERVRQSLCGPR